MPLKAAAIAEKLSRSQIFKDYERAFGELTGLPLSLRTEEVLKLVQHGKKHENPFCALLAKNSHSCAECLRVQDTIGRQKGIHAHTVSCFAGLCDTAVPIQIGDLKIGLLQTGQVVLKKPNRQGFRKAARQLLEWGSSVNLQKLEEAYFHSQVLSSEQYKSAIRLLEIFGQHLSVAANDLMLNDQAGEPASEMTILIGQDDGIRLIADSDWPLDSLALDRGAKSAYRISGDPSGTVRVEGREGLRRCIMETPSPAKTARLLLGS